MSRKKEVIRILLVLVVVLVTAFGLYFSKNKEKTTSNDQVAEKTNSGDLIAEYQLQLPELAEKAKSGNVDDLHKYAVAQYATGDPAGAEKTYREQIAGGTDNAEVYNSLANSLRDQGKFPEAVVEYEKAIEKDKKMLKAYYNLGSMYQNMMDNCGKAIDVYKKGIENNPKSSDMFFYLGNAYEKANDMNGAKDAYESALGIDKNNVAAKAALERLGI